MHDDTKHHSFGNGKMDRTTSSTDYQHPNRLLKFKEEIKKNSKSQISTDPELRGSPFIRKSHSKSMSIPHLDPFALTQFTLSINTTIASDTDAGASDSSASQSSFETNLPSIRPFVSTETMNTKFETASFETCVIY